jgi:phosphate uptake regulator
MPDRPPGPDAYDADLSVTRNGVEGAAVGLAVWSYRREPDAAARRAANDALDAIDAAIAALYRVRSQLVTEVRRSDDEAAVRVDKLLARPRDGGGP